ncbi:putative phage membrane protein [Pseudomonas syringae pv. aceris]|jgi:hypothetical protein|nr:hypothetical protein AC517_3864 [Pseudomonas syringae pv. syringae]RMS60326.1 putative phage membrane protein [Pseudomonas syringae pv. aceris]RMS63390.1 putative phage membrane protein [Pseudomonas syringae pv. aceris]
MHYKIIAHSAGWAYTAAEPGLIACKTVVTEDSIVSTEDQVF